MLRIMIGGVKKLVGVETFGRFRCGCSFFSFGKDNYQRLLRVCGKHLGINSFELRILDRRGLELTHRKEI